MREAQHLYIDGKWTTPVDGKVHELTDPATGKTNGRIVLGGAADVDRAVRAAREAFPAFSATSVVERIELLKAIGFEYARRAEDMAQAVTAELGSPLGLSRTLHVPANDSPYGLCGYVTSADPRRARTVAEQMRTGYVLINDADFDFNTAWGGYKQSGNGREWADFGIAEYLETKSIVGVTT